MNTSNLAQVRPEFMTPFPMRNRQSRVSTEPSALGKRKYSQSFRPVTFDDQRYGQEIDNEYFKHNIGHTVCQPEPRKPSKCQETVDELISDYRAVFNREQLEALGTSCDTVEDIVAWCEIYMNQKLEK
jgi:hypothetical protein